jgi:phage terminase large subunit-like protein
VDYDRIRTRMNELNKQYQVKQVAIDRWNATQLATQLTDDGFEMVALGKVMPVPKGEGENSIPGLELRRDAYP